MMKYKYIREWCIDYEIHDGEGGLEEFMVVLPSFGKVFGGLSEKAVSAATSIFGSLAEK